MERPTTSGSSSRTSRLTVSRTCGSTAIKAATATRCCGSTFPASDVSAPLGIRIACGGMCSKESGMESNRMFISACSYCFNATSQPRVEQNIDQNRAKSVVAIVPMLAAKCCPDVKKGRTCLKEAASETSKPLETIVCAVEGARQHG